jgi:hypothetical protein
MPRFLWVDAECIALILRASRISHEIKEACARTMTTEQTLQETCRTKKLKRRGRSAARDEAAEGYGKDERWHPRFLNLDDQLTVLSKSERPKEKSGGRSAQDLELTLGGRTDRAYDKAPNSAARISRLNSPTSATFFFRDMPQG